ncbi:MAG TPA: ATP-binding protein [Verrucomicrobiae bacterium]|jgi:signal transduction histidine kinase
MITRVVFKTAVLSLLWCIAGTAAETAGGAPSIQKAIKRVEVDSRRLSWQPGGALSLGTSPRDTVFSIGVPPDSKQTVMRFRTKLEPLDREWQEYGGEMFMTIRFYNQAGDLVGQKVFEAHGESAGWNGTLEHSTFTHRREAVPAPPDAASLWVVLSSAGGPTTVGVYIIDDVVVSRMSKTNGAPQVLLQSPTSEDLAGLSAPNQAPPGWEHDGTRPSMARIVEAGDNPKLKALAVLDDDPMSHAEWHNSRESAARVAPNESLWVEWNEMYSIGVSMDRDLTYGRLPPGSYKFRVQEVSLLGKPTGREASLAVLVLLPFWRATWFWASLAALAAASSVLSARYMAGQRMKRAMARLEQQQALERERLRIAQDIHDDLGARVTEISLLSGMAEKNARFSDQAREEFCRITMKSRDLVAALYETVWAVNPENDNLEAVGNYLRQRINNQCTQAQLSCRLHISPLPRDIEISSRIRHNISMAAREAMHNVIKHAGAAQVTVHISFDGNLFAVSIHDDGRGFNPSADPTGYGLANMNRRLEHIGGDCAIESSPGAGATVRFRLRVQRSDPPANGAASQPV